MKNKKKKIIMMSIGIILLLIAIVGASYAYFAATIGSGSTTPVTVEAGTIDSLVFNTGNPIVLEANQDNFASGQGNRSGSTTASAILTANNQAESAVTYTYNVFLNITKNTYIKTGNSAELILRVTDPNTGNLISLSNLTQVTAGGVTGYDITEEGGLIVLASGYEISTLTTKTDTWNVSVTFANLSSDQSDNAGAEFEAKIQITRGNYEAESIDIDDSCSQGDLLNDCIISTYTRNGDGSLYFHGKSLAKGAQDNSYRYAGGPTAINVATHYYMPALYNNGVDSDVYDISDGTEYQAAVALLVQRQLITLSGDYNEIATVRNGHTWDTSTSEGALGAINEMIQLGYIVSLPIEDPNNYVCFGTPASTCDYDYLYRIIGVIPTTLSDGTTKNLVKLIKADYINNGYTGSVSYTEAAASSYNGYTGNLYTIAEYELAPTATPWVSSDLNTIGLNDSYLNSYLASSWLVKIAEVKWQVGGNVFSSIASKNAKQVYTSEIVNPSTNQLYTAKIGLMYVSDYMYANPNWSVESSDSALGTNGNWMYAGVDEWTITRETGNTSWGFSITRGSTVAAGSSSNNYAVRPVFYLKNSVTYQSGTGTLSDPIRIS